MNLGLKQQIKMWDAQNVTKKILVILGFVINNIFNSNAVFDGNDSKLRVNSNNSKY